MAKMNRLLVKDLEKYYRDGDVYTLKFDDIEINYKKYLTVPEKLEFVRDFLSLCFVDGLYQPALFDFSLRCTTIAYYSNVLIPVGHKKANNLAYNSGIYELLIENIHKSEHESLIDAVKKTIEDVTNKDPLEKIVLIFEDLVNKIEHEIGSVDLEQLNKLLNTVNELDSKKELVEQFSNMYLKE